MPFGQNVVTFFRSALLPLTSRLNLSRSCLIRNTQSLNLLYLYLRESILNLTSSILFAKEISCFLVAEDFILTSRILELMVLRNNQMISGSLRFVWLKCKTRWEKLCSLLIPPSNSRKIIFSRSWYSLTCPSEQEQQQGNRNLSGQDLWWQAQWSPGTRWIS